MEEGIWCGARWNGGSGWCAQLVVVVVVVTLGIGCDHSRAVATDGGSWDVPVPARDAQPYSCESRAAECQAPTASNVCLQGQVFRFATLSARWAGLEPHAKPLSDKDGAELKVYDPLEFVGNPNTAPLATASIDANGCFVVPSVAIPFAGFLALVVDDQSPGQDQWAMLFVGETPTTSKNSTDLEVPAVQKAEAQAWGHELLDNGAQIVLFRDEKTGMAVEGVTPTFGGQPPPWQDAAVLFFDDDIRTPPYFDLSATATTKSGMVAAKGAARAFSGELPGCTMESTLGGSAPGSLFFGFRDVSCPP